MLYQKLNCFQRLRTKKCHLSIYVLMRASHGGIQPEIPVRIILKQKDCGFSASLG